MRLNRTATKTLEGEVLVREYVATRSQRAKERVIQAYLPLVKHIIGRINIPENGVLRREDIYQFGIVGLLDALERFQPEYGVSFKTYAYKRINGEIVDAIRKEGVLSREQMKKVNGMLAAADKLRVLLGREPTVVEICDEIGISEEDYHAIQQLTDLSFTLSLDESISADGENSILRKDTITDEAQMPPDVVLEKEGLREELRKIIQELSERKRLVLALYYYEELTLFDIGQVLGLSESRVSQILNQTLTEIRKRLKF